MRSLVAVEHGYALIVARLDVGTAEVGRIYKSVDGWVDGETICESCLCNSVARRWKQFIRWRGKGTTFGIFMALDTRIVIKHHATVEHYGYYRVRSPIHPIPTAKHDVHHRAVLCRHNLKETHIDARRVVGAVSYSIVWIGLHNILVPQHLGRQQVGHVDDSK